MKKALIVWGGWDGHEPQKVAEIFSKQLRQNGIETEIADTLDAFNDAGKLRDLHLIVPVWTMGEIGDEQCANVMETVASGTGIAGCHGGMCDAFRNSVRWQFMTGGNWVAHPGGDGTEYEINVRNTTGPVMNGVTDFKVKSEQYYMHVDPAVEVLAVTRFPVENGYHVSNGAVEMPVAWTKKWGVGRVFYTSLGHHADIFDIPEALRIMTQGMIWAAEGKDFALQKDLNADQFKSEKSMF
jgi:type 1 glutamine amidotransferase